MGDVHYWQVWHASAPFTEYEKQFPRFMSEYGFQSFPQLETVATYTEPGIGSVGMPARSIGQPRMAAPIAKNKVGVIGSGGASGKWRQLTRRSRARAEATATTRAFSVTTCRQRRQSTPLGSAASRAGRCRSSISG